MAIRESVTLAELAPWLARLGEQASRLSWTRALKAGAVMLAADTKERFETQTAPDGSPWRPLAHARPNSKGGDLPLRNNGILMASATGRGQGHVESLTDTSLEYGTNLEYARLMQEGGTVTPTSAKMLAIPLTKEAARNPRPRQFPGGLFVLKSKAGKLFLAQNQQKGRGKKKARVLALHYLLASQVTIPARPFIGLSDKFLRRFGQLLADEVERQLGSGPSAPSSAP